MSNTTIEKNIVQMEFDARKFRDGVKQSTDDLSAFKKSFDMKGAIDAMSSLEKASQLDFTLMADSLDSINNKLSIVGVAAAAMVTKIIDSMVSIGAAIPNALFIDPVKTGLEEYETQLNAVQTILANTQKEGTTLKDVNGALDELNTYADLTIYNFTQMTNNIGKFTAAGVKLDTSVAAIKGISNLAALSGSDANQASQAMYQLSQAISTGSLKLQDWNSVVTAGMGGQVFQDALVETARQYNPWVDNLIKRAGSFRESLTDGWITTEVLLETLNKFTGDLSDEQLRSMGYSEEQIDSIQKQAEVALDAATKIKTVTQLIDTMKEALQSGWGLTWRIIFGDFEQAKELWGGVAEILGNIIEESSASRNRLLQAWSNIGGRDILIQAFFDILKAGVNVLKAFQEAIGSVFKPLDAFDLLSITEKIGDFALKIRMGTNNLDHFKSIVSGVAAAFDIAVRFVAAFIKPLLVMAKGVELVDGGIWSLLAGVGDAIVAWREWAIETDWFSKAFDHTAEVIKYVVGQIKILVKRFQALDIVQKVSEWIQSITITSEDLVNVWNIVLTILKAIVAPFYLLGAAIQQLAIEIPKLKIVKDMVEWWNGIDWKATAQWFKDIGDNAKKMFNDFKESEVMKSFLGYISTFDGRRFEQFQKDAKEGFSWVGEVSDFLKPKLEGLVDTIKGWGPKVKELAEGLKQGIKDVFDYLTTDAENLNYETLFDIINTGILGGVLLALRKIASGDFISGIIDDSDFGEGLIDMFDGLNSTLGSFQNNIRADSLRKIAISIGILALSLWLLTKIEAGKLKDATAAIVIMTAALFGSAGALGKINHKSALQSALAIIGLSTALVIMGVALKLIAGIDPVEMENGLTAIGLALVGLVGAIQALKTGTSTLKTIVVMQGIAIALLMLWGVIQLYGIIDPDVLAQGLIGVGFALGELTASLAILSKTGGDKNSSLKAALAMLAIAKSMDKLFEAVLKFGLLNMKVLVQGLVTIGLLVAGMAGFSKIVQTEKILQAAIAMLIMGGALVVIAVALEMMGNLDMYDIFVGLVTIAAILVMFVLAANMMQSALPGAAAILVMSVALIALGVALKVISSMSVEELVIAIIAIAAVLGVFILAGYLLAPIVPVLIGFGLALFLIGAGAALFGFGIFLAATGLVALAGASVLIAQGIRIVGGALIETMPQIGTAFAETISNFVITLAEKAPELSDAFQTIILEMIGSFTEIWPQIAELIGTMVVDLVTVLLEKFVELYGTITDAGYDLLLEFLHGIEDNIQEIVDTALGVVEEFIKGVTEGLPGVITAAVELFFTFLETIEQEVLTEENVDRMIKIGFNIAKNIVKGVISGLTAGVTDIVNKIGEITGLGKQEMEEGWEQKSPSKFTYRVATNVIKGFVNGISDGIKAVRNAISGITKEGKSQFDPFLRLLDQELNNDFDIRPTITPIFDLSEVSTAAGLIQQAIGSVTVPTDLTNVGSINTVSNADASNASAFSNGKVVYNQYNYSPKALDRAGIYRDTKTHVSKLELRRLGA